MQITNVSAGYSDPATRGRQGESVEGAAEKSSAILAAKSSPYGGTAAALGEILSRYDVTDISPGEFTEMIQKLYEAGALNEQELQQLAIVRHDLDTDGVEPDESINLLEYYVEKIERLQRQFDISDAGTQSNEQLGPLLRRLDWIEKFALVQSASNATGLDMVA